MIELHRVHRDFDMTMEVACLLPHLPRTVDMGSIEKDLGITRESLNAKLHKLAKRYRITYRPGVNDMAVGVGSHDWPTLQSAAESYYNNVYKKETA